MRARARWPAALRLPPAAAEPQVAWPLCAQPCGSGCAGPGCRWRINDHSIRPALRGVLCGRRAGGRLLRLLAGISSPVTGRSGAGAVWAANDRPWRAFGFSLPVGWRLSTSIALFVLLATYQAYAVATVARSAEQRAGLRQQLGTITAVLPHTRRELYWFGGVSLTAGFCEEFLYRGDFVWVFSPRPGLRCTPSSISALG